MWGSLAVPRISAHASLSPPVTSQMAVISLPQAEISLPFCRGSPTLQALSMGSGISGGESLGLLFLAEPFGQKEALAYPVYTCLKFVSGHETLASLLQVLSL